MLGDNYADQASSLARTQAPLQSLQRAPAFASLLRKANIPHIRFHDLRHTCATLLLGKGTHPKFVQELVGHATVTITLDTYSHVMPDMGDQTAPWRKCSYLCRTPSPKSAALVSEGWYVSLASVSSRHVSSANCTFSRWTMLGSNQRPPPCKGGALPLS